MSHSDEETQELVVEAREGQYLIEAAAGRDNVWPPPLDGLTTGEDSWTAVLTGTSWGPVTVHLQSLDRQPDTIAGDWEMIVERDIVTDESGGLEVRGIFQEGAAGGVPLPPGRYRLRIHVRGRSAAAPHNILETPVEAHLIQLWPTTAAHPPAVLVGPDDEASRKS
ncbi:hypothetical protein ACH35V_02105 [Actinomadura sp. 1N219]|uniref:hypothetical protein n=1 Tax=Actinomadura sp. 1N219 TaxID=3375152 RepID=UPI00379E99DC